MKKPLLKTIQVLLYIFICSCGYKVDTGKIHLPDGSTKLHIKPFTNATTTAQVEKFFTDALKREFYGHKGLRLVSKEEADVIIEGSVASISTAGTAFRTNVNENLEANEYLLTITVSMKMFTKKNTEIWEKTISEQEIFNVFENIMKSESERLKAASRIAKNMMRKVYDNLYENFK